MFEIFVIFFPIPKNTLPTKTIYYPQKFSPLKNITMKMSPIVDFQDLILDKLKI